MDIFYKRTLIIFIILITTDIFVYAQPCAVSGNVTLSSQSDIDNFIISYPNCNSIQGNLSIYGSDINNFNGINNIDTITGGLHIGNYGVTTYLSNLNGLENIKFVGLGIDIINIDGLQNLSGLDGLGGTIGALRLEKLSGLENCIGLESITYIVNKFIVFDNPDLINFEGLNNLDSIGWDFDIAGEDISYSGENPSLENFIGLDNLKFIRGSFNISGNVSLIDFQGLENLEKVGNMETFQNPLLENFTGLSNVQKIYGKLFVSTGFSPSFNLNGFNNLESIGSLEIAMNPSLVNLDGLNNLTYIEGDLSIHETTSLENFVGLESLEWIGGEFKLLGNESLENLLGLSSLDSIGDGFEIKSNPLIQTFEGTNSLRTIGSYDALDNDEFRVYSNPKLENLNGLENLQTINGRVIISLCDSLINVDGIGNVNWDDVEDIIIFNNDNLSSCSIDLVCGYIIENDIAPQIYNNGIYCNYEYLLSNACGFGPCLEGGITFTSQSEIDNFIYEIGFCTGILGDVVISGDDITNLDGLGIISSIGGDLSIISNPNLTDISGLNDIDSIGGKLVIEDNYNLVDILPFLSLNYINGDLVIANNQSLESIKGLRYIDASSISNLVIVNNPNLSECDYESICNYIGAPSGNINVSNNATNCSSLEELEEECLFGHCLIDGINFQYQNSIDNFLIEYPYCDVIEGDVTFSNSAVLPIISLEGMHNIVEIEGDLNIGDYYEGLDYLTNLTGLENLKIINGTLTISTDLIHDLHGLENLTKVNEIKLRNNTMLENLDGLENISELEGGLSISRNELGPSLSLENVQGLNNLTTVGYLSIIGTEYIQDFEGFNNIEEIKDGIYLSNNLGLNSINGFSSLQKIGGQIYIGGNSNLNDLSSLSQIDSIHGNLTIFSNSSLESLQGLQNVLFLNGFIYISYNNELSDISSLAQINSDSISELSISQNPFLEVCAIEPICEYLSYSSENASIFNNADGCNSVVEVIEACGGCFQDGITFTSQLEIDSFPIFHADCTNIWGDLIISGNDIVNVDGLSQLTTIKGNLIIEYNPVLENLDGLNGLNTINDNNLIIHNNQTLSSLIGLNNIYDPSFNYLEISDNENLSYCAVESVCSHLSYFGEYYINNNSGDCLTEFELAVSCDPLIEDNPFEIYPNPSNGVINIASIVNAPIDQVTIYDQIGNELYTTTDDITLLDISFLDSGIYIVSILSDGVSYQILLVLS